ncbi:hypothetical protein [Enterococcus sp. CWB-B31]|uniref:hypothetical protein n=1 Tax=Enterococcus sp. CWB-B31 TaxID=2885159 RepID=UPI001E3E186D|nr:hypothetical protein [Enterococcus sp. CWB-B31]MCB5956432.1 hypothetical protein [Enterococcus sp. CWB-B31]
MKRQSKFMQQYHIIYSNPEIMVNCRNYYIALSAFVKNDDGFFTKEELKKAV